MAMPPTTGSGAPVMKHPPSTLSLPPTISYQPGRQELLEKGPIEEGAMAKVTHVDQITRPPGLGVHQHEMELQNTTTKTGEESYKRLKSNGGSQTTVPCRGVRETFLQVRLSWTLCLSHLRALCC